MTLGASRKSSGFGGQVAPVVWKGLKMVFTLQGCKDYKWTMNKDCFTG